MLHYHKFPSSPEPVSTNVTNFHHFWKLYFLISTLKTSLEPKARFWVYFLTKNKENTVSTESTDRTEGTGSMIFGSSLEQKTRFLIPVWNKKPRARKAVKALKALKVGIGGTS